MHIRQVTDIPQPLRSPLGEIVYELVGAAPGSGSTNKHSLAYIILPPGGRSSHHYHQVSEESYYIMSGQGQMIIDGEIFTLSTGQACLIKPPSHHEFTNNGDVDLVFLAVCTPAWTLSDSFPVETK
jgi:mannose-6-phosphate isomerase-like protein (cupin superfamily)